MTIPRSNHDSVIIQSQPISTVKRVGKALSRQRYGSIEPEDTIGQFSFGPATQTTVVTTTTTTTTRFPPFVLRSSRRADQLDTKLYPLAAAPTPTSLRRITFNHDGKQVVFREAPDTTLALEDTVEEIDRLRRGNGFVQTIQQGTGNTTDKTEHGRPDSKMTNDVPASPKSINEIDGYEEEKQSPALSIQRRRAGKQKAAGPRSHLSHPRLREVQLPNPLTPEIHDHGDSARSRSARAPSLQPYGIQPLLPSPDTDNRLEAAAHRTESPFARQTSPEDDGITRSDTFRTAASRASLETTVPTPPIEQENSSAISRPLSGRALSSIPARLHVSDSPSTQEGNLPSPSLSPVTAAANAHRSGYFHDIDSDVASRHARSTTIDNTTLDDAASIGRYSSPAATENGEYSLVGTMGHAFSGSSIGDMPAMIDFFEALPDELKSYAMHQLLRRCPKSTLQMVADVVNPALKCDFLSILPVELGLNVLSYLDVKSLCKAAQVSKKWRQMINSDERAWKELFDADGFTLPEGELQKAITQGWGWQDPHGVEGHERDLSLYRSLREDSEAPCSSSSMTQTKKSSSGSLRRSKRKAAGLLSHNRSKQLKRSDRSREVSADIDFIDCMAQVSSAEGPYNAANAAMLAVPNPKTELPSLNGLHLYKSLYRRHHLVRRNWMYEETKPRHIAFRAHDSHVVTCLQFDTDKILTGSDDNNINVYDTKTGALRQLLRGHEGGVWALQYEGNTLVSGSTDRSVRVWDIEKGIETQVFRGHTSTVRCLQIVTPVKVGETSEGRAVMMPPRPLIITGSRDSTLRVWRLPLPHDKMYIQAESDTETDDCPFFVRTLTGHQHSVRAIAAHADTLVSGSYDCTVRVWKISTGETIHRLQGHTQKVYSVVLDQARNRCISGSMDNLVKIWSLDTGSALFTLEGHSSLVGLLDLNCDRLVSAAADSTLRIWDPENGQCKATLSAHTGAITCFQHDGQKVISGSDRTLKMWNIKTGDCMKDLLSELSGVWQVKFNERRCVAAVQRDNMTYIEVLDFGASRDGIPESQRGRRIVVDAEGREIEPTSDDPDTL